MASAQVKSCILLAGMYAADGPDDGRRVAYHARPHGAAAARGGRARRVAPGRRSAWPAQKHRARPPSRCPATSRRPRRSSSPRACSRSRSCSCAASATRPSRAGLLTVLEHMGARIASSTAARRRAASRSRRRGAPSELVGSEIGPEIVPSLIDELPLLALPAPWRAADRRTRRGGAAGQGVEPARDASRSCCGRSAGTCARPTTAGRSRACRRRPEGGRVDAHGDHRIGMLGAVAGLVSRATGRASTAPPPSTSRSRGSPTRSSGSGR